MLGTLEFSESRFYRLLQDRVLQSSGKQAFVFIHGYNVSFDDIKQAVLPGLRHRLILNFEGEAEGITSDEILEQIIDEVPTAVAV